MKEATRTRGINPHRYKKPTQQQHIEVNCLKCNVTIDMTGELDGEPTVVVGCPNCKTIFNRETGEILGDNGA